MPFNDGHDKWEDHDVFEKRSVTMAGSARIQLEYRGRGSERWSSGKL